MKKLLTTVACAACFASVASADFARVEMGAGMWSQTPNGILSYTDGSATGKYISNETNDKSAYVWMLIKHPIPILPNLRLEYTALNDTGKVKGSFEDFEVDTWTTASLELKQFDIIPYYNIVDNTFWTTVDVGLDFKVQESTYTAEAVKIGGITGLNYTDKATTVIPLAYLRARVEIPATNIGLESDIKYISYDGSTVYDARAKVDYTLDMFPVVQPAIEVGYRVQKFDVSSSDDKTKMDLEFAGVYAGMMLRF